MRTVQYKDWIVYDDGRVYSTIRHRFLKLSKPDKCGYIYCNIDKRWRLHRLIAELFIPNPNNYPVVDHIDRNPLNNNVNNLRWCTQSTNCRNTKRNTKYLIKELSLTFQNRIEIAEYLNTYPEYITHCIKHSKKINNYTIIKL